MIAVERLREDVAAARRSESGRLRVDLRVYEALLDVAEAADAEAVRDRPDSAHTKLLELLDRLDALADVALGAA